MATTASISFARSIIKSPWTHSRLVVSRSYCRSSNVYSTLRISNRFASPTLQLQRRYASSDHLPIIIRPSFWRSLIPRFLRRSEAEELGTKEWNPATFFIFIFMFIGSQAIQIVSLHRSFDEFSRETETRLALLREVVKRVQDGEDVDVEAILGTGKEKEEKAWEEVIRELEHEDSLIRLRKRTEKKRASKGDNDASGEAGAT